MLSVQDLCTKWGFLVRIRLLTLGLLSSCCVNCKLEKCSELACSYTRIKAEEGADILGGGSWIFCRFLAYGLHTRTAVVKNDPVHN